MAVPDLKSFILRSEVLHLYRRLLRVAKGAQDPASRGAPLGRGRPPPPPAAAAAGGSAPSSLHAVLLHWLSHRHHNQLVCNSFVLLLPQRSCGARSGGSLRRSGGGRSQKPSASFSATVGLHIWGGVNLGMGQLIGTLVHAASCH